MVKAQEWIDKEYPKDKVCASDYWLSENNKGKKREEIEELILVFEDLEGGLDLTDFTALKKIHVSGNPCLGEVRHEGKRIEIINNIYNCVSAQEWLDKNYPKEKRGEITKLVIREKELLTENEYLGGELKLEGFSNLEEFSMDWSDSNIREEIEKNCFFVFPGRLN